MEYINCNFCKKDNLELLFSIEVFLSGKKEKFNLVRCRNCGLIYINPRPEKQEIYKYYSQEKYYSFSQLEKKLQNKLSFLEGLRSSISQRTILHYYKGDFSSSSKLQRALRKFAVFLGRYRLAAHTVAPPCIKKGRILDLGCGDGVFLDALRKIGWQTFGIEINETAARKGQEGGLNILNKDLLETSFPSDFFDVVRMWSVLEHLHRPYETLKEIYRILKPDGILIAQMPNFDSLAAKIFKEKWAALIKDLHLYHFNSRILEKILKENNFTILKIYTCSVGTIGASLNLGKLYYVAVSMLIFFDFFLDRLGLGDCLVVFARKES